MKVTYSRRSLRQIEEIHDYVSERNPRAVREVIVRISELCERLSEFPKIGTATDQPSVRMLPVVRYPYNIYYAVLADQDEVRILRVRHGARRQVPLSHDELSGK